MTYEQLGAAMGLPPGVRVVGVADEYNDCFSLYLRGPGLPPVEQGEKLPRVVTIVQQQRNDGGAVIGRTWSFEPILIPLQDEVDALRTEVRRLQSLMQDDGK